MTTLGVQVHGCKHCDHICPHDLSHSQTGHILRCNHPTIAGIFFQFMELLLGGILLGNYAGLVNLCTLSVSITIIPQ